MAKNAENGFIQRTILNQRYGVNCNKLTLWEYMLLIEHTHKRVRIEYTNIILTNTRATIKY